MTRIYAGHTRTVSALPAGLFETLEALLAGREDAFAVVEIVSQGPNKRQVDCAVFSAGGIDVIEIKDWRNPVIGGDGIGWQTDDGILGLNEHSNPKAGRLENPYEQAGNTAADVKAWLGRRRGIQVRKLKVYPLVLIPFAAVDCQIGPHQSVELALGLGVLGRKLRALTKPPVKAIWQPTDYADVPKQLGLIPIDLVEIRGHTVNGTDGAALRRVRIEVEGLRQPLEVDSRGNFAFTTRPGHRLTLRLRPATLHAPLEHVIDVEPQPRLIELEPFIFGPLPSPQVAAHTEREVIAVQREMERLRAEHARELQRVADELQVATREAERHVAEVMRRQTAEACELERLHVQRATDLEHIQHLEDRVSTADRDLAALDHLRPDHTARVTELEKERQTHLAQLHGLRVARGRSLTLMEEAEQRAESLARDLEALQQELPGQQQRLEHLEEQARTQQSELQSLREENARVRRELALAARTSEDTQVFARQVEAEQARTRVIEQRAQDARQSKECATGVLTEALAEAGQREAALQQREAELQGQLRTALERLQTVSVDAGPRLGEVFARAAAWASRKVQADGDTNTVNSPLGRIALSKLQEGTVFSGASLPQKIPAITAGTAAGLAVWELSAETLLVQIRILQDRMRTQPPKVDVHLHAARVGQLQDALQEVQDVVDGYSDDSEGALKDVQQLLARLAPEGPEEAPVLLPARERVTLDAGAVLSDQAQLWVIVGGRLQHLETGKEADLLIPGWSSSSLEELDGLVGLREGNALVPVWALAAERQIEAWLPDSWAVTLVEENPEQRFEERAAALSPAQFGAVCCSLPLNRLLTWTGQSWPASLLEPLHAAVLSRFAEELQSGGACVQNAPVDGKKVENPLGFPALTAVEAPAEAGPRDGLSVLLDGLNLDARVAKALPEHVREKGFYLHQALALRLIRDARRDSFDVVLSTPTASGKTMAFLPGVLESVIQTGGTALFLYPLRALSADQLRTLTGVLKDMGPDAPALGQHFGKEKVNLKEGVPRLLVATPDKLNHALDQDWWRQFASRLRFVVLDEAHTYRGAFGTNMSAFLRRLLALCPEPPTLIISTATLQNTIPFSRNLTGRQDFRVVGKSTAPRYSRHLYVGELAASWGYRPHLAALRGIGRLVRGRHGKALIFAGSRQTARDIARELSARTDSRLEPVSFPFYSGMKKYDSELVRLRETDTVKDGTAMLAASTSTLEAGIDIGDLDVVTVVGFPRSRNSFKQMAGRAGRSGTAHIAFLPGDSPADVYYARPAALTNLLLRESEPVYLNPHNPVLVAGHVDRARYELEQAGLSTGPDLLNVLFPEGLHVDDDEVLRALFTGPVFNARAPLLRGTGVSPHVVVSVGTSLPDQPREDEINLVVPEEGADWLIERLSVEAAYRDWPLDGRVLRGDRFYRVIGWRRGQFCEGQDGYSQEAVIIAVQDITDQTLPPEEVLTYRVRPAEEQVLPSGQFAPRTVARRTRLAAMPTRLDDPTTCGPLAVAVGVGEISLKEGAPVLGELQIQALCERADRKFRSPDLTKLGAVGVEVIQGRQVVEPAFRVSSLSPWLGVHPLMQSGETDPLRTAYALPEQLDERSSRTILQVSRHEHEIHTEGRCSCGGAVTLRPFWSGAFSSVREQLPPLSDDPHRTAAHDLERHTFQTEMAQLRLQGAEEGARRALLLAIVKSLPDLLEVDPQEFSVGIVACPAQGSLEARMWDVIPGGTGISAALGEIGPSMLSAAAAALTYALKECSCRGQGCYGCILPLERLVNLTVRPADDQAESQRLADLSSSGFSAELDIYGALHLCLQEVGV